MSDAIDDCTKKATFPVPLGHQFRQSIELVDICMALRPTRPSLAQTIQKGEQNTQTMRFKYIFDGVFLLLRQYVLGPHSSMRRIESTQSDIV